MQKQLKNVSLILLLLMFINSLHAVDIEDTEVYAGAGFEFVHGAGYVFPAIEASAGIGGFLSDLEWENIFVEASLAQAIIPAFYRTGASFLTNVSAYSGLMFQLDEIIKIKPKLGLNFAFSSATVKVALSTLYGVTGYYYLEEMRFDIYVDLVNSLNFLQWGVFTTRLSAGVQIPYAF